MAGVLSAETGPVLSDRAKASRPKFKTVSTVVTRCKGIASFVRNNEEKHLPTRTAVPAAPYYCGLVEVLPSRKACNCRGELLWNGLHGVVLLIFEDAAIYH
jgi:hypothetical protein